MRTLVAMVVLVAASAPALAAPTADELCAMVAKSSELSVVYVNDPADAAARIFDLYGVGETSAKHLVVFGRQVSGYSPSSDGGSAKLPGWRTFRVDRLKTIDDSGKIFAPETPTAADARIVATWSCANAVVPKG